VTPNKTTHDLARQFKATRAVHPGDLAERSSQLTAWEGFDVTV